MKVDGNKGICPEFGRNVLDCCRDDNDDMTLVDTYIHETYAVPTPRAALFEPCPALPLIYHTLD